MIRESTGIVGDVKGLASTGLRAVRTRLELLAIEITEEKAWAVRFLIVALAALYLLGFGLLLAMFALVVWASAENRPAILATFAGVFLLLGAGGLAYIFAASKRRHPIFTETIAVLKGDEQALGAGLRAAGD
ncbi:MAG TPA: phage holin family protein [Usitatibacter sp.]